jgi:hypothetical protein
MQTIEEAIAHCKKVSLNQNYTEQGRKHTQLAEWLEELVLLRFKVARLEERAKEAKATDNSAWEYTDDMAMRGISRQQFYGEFS